MAARGEVARGLCGRVGVAVGHADADVFSAVEGAVGGAETGECAAGGDVGDRDEAADDGEHDADDREGDQKDEEDGRGEEREALGEG